MIRKDIINLNLLLLVSSIISKTLSFPANIIIAYLLGPYKYGVLSFFSLIIGYFGIFNLGLNLNLTRELPIAHGKNDSSLATKIKNTVYSNLVITTIFGLFILILLYISGLNFNNEITLSVFIILMLTIFVSRIDAFFSNILRGEGQYSNFGKLNIIIQTIQPIITILLVLFFNLLGLLIAIFFQSVLSALFSYAFLKYPKFSFRFDIPFSLTLFKTGFFMYLNNTIEYFLLGFCSLLISIYYNSIMLGIFSYAVLIVSDPKIPLTNSLSIVFARQMALDVGVFGESNYTYFKKYLGKEFVLYILSIFIILGLSVLLYSYIITHYIVKYHNSIIISQFLFFGYSIYSIRSVLYNYLNATNQMKKRTFILIFGFIINTLGVFYCINYGYGIQGIALTLSIVLTLVSLSTLFFCYNQIYESKIIAIRFILKIIIILALLTSTLLILSSFNFFGFPNEQGKAIQFFFGIFDFITKSIIFIVIALCCFAIIFNDLYLISEFKKIVFEVFLSFRKNLKTVTTAVLLKVK